MEQDLKVNNSIPSTLETNQGKRPYNKIPQEVRSQIIHALTIDKLPIVDVAAQYGTKVCTCKAILSTYELEGRSEKKTTRRERVEVESKIVLKIVDPLNRLNTCYENQRSLKMYAEGKDLSPTEQATLKKKLIQEVSEQLGELQTGCYQLQSQQTEIHDEKAPQNVMRGINLGLHVVTSKVREGQLEITKKEIKSKVENKTEKVASKTDKVLQVQLQLSEYFKQFINSVHLKMQKDPLLVEHLRNLTAVTVAQSQFTQKLHQREQQVQQTQQQLKSVINKMLNDNS